jgi:hypothetical protein
MFVVAGLLIVYALLEIIMNQVRPRGEWIIRLVALAGLLLTAWISIVPSFGRDVDGRYADSPLKPWFDSLRSGKGPCCSDADGTALSDTDWDFKNGHYLVFIENKWWVVPDEAVIKEPNKVGRTMVWPTYYRANGVQLDRVDIRCFMPGSMT